MNNLTLLSYLKKMYVISNVYVYINYFNWLSFQYMGQYQYILRKRAVAPTSNTLKANE